MKKLSLEMLRLSSNEVLERSQMKKITGGYGTTMVSCTCSTSGGGSSSATCTSDLAGDGTNRCCSTNYGSSSTQSGTGCT